MSEENRYDSHPIAVPSHYSIHVPQTNGGVLYPSVAPQTPGNQYRYRAEGPEYRYNMNGVAGGPQPNHHPHQPFLYGGAMPSVSRGPPQWQQFYATSDTEQARRNLSHDAAQSTPAPYPPTEMADSWSKAPTSFVRSQHSQNQNFSHSHNMGGHSSNYNLHHHSQSYSRPLHNPLEPSAAPSPPNPYPGSPRTPISSQQTVGTNGIPAPQPFRQSSQSRAPLAVSTAASDNSIYRSEPSSSHANSYPNSCQSSPSTNSLLPRQGRNSMVSPLGPPVNPPSNYVENSNHCSFVRRDSDGFGRHPNVAENDGKGPGSVPKTTQSHYSQPEYDSEDDKQVKRERHSRSPSVSMSPRTARADRPNDRSPSFSGSATKESKSGLELPGKKKGMPVFRGSDGTDYYENEPVPPGVEIPEGWQIGTGKQTKGLLLPRVKDGIQVNPEWGFTAGGRARQRLPQACKNCRAKKIRCVESDYDELVCQHCMKMRIQCQRYDKDDDKKKKHRASQSQEYIKTENGAGRSVSVASDTGMPMVKSGTKKRRSTDESLNGNKRLNRGTGSRASSITREPLNTNLADSSPPVRRQQMQSALPLETEKPPLFPSDPTDATAVRQDQADSRGKLVKALRENQFQVSQSQEMYGHGRTSLMPDSSPYSYTSTSPTTSVSNGPLGFIENQTYGVITESRHRTMRSSTPATMTGTPPMSSIPHAIGEDPRHLDLPGPPKLFRLMEAYFENVYSQTYAFLHRKTFMENLENHPLVLLFSMCAVAARFSDYASSETVYAARARELIMLNYDSYTLEVVQSMVNMGLHDFGSNNGHKAWMFAGMAVRMGAALNMNLENRKKEKNKNVIAKECARRTYWSYYLMDRFNSYGVARPFLTQDHDCHIQLPCNQPSFTNGRYVVTEHLLGPNPYHPQGGSKYMGAMAYLVRVVGIWGNILRQIHLSGFQTYSTGEMYSHNGNQSIAGNEFNDFIGKLESWRKTLPSGLQYSNENLAGQIKVGTTGAFVMMHVMWHTAMAYVHRYVRTVGVPKDFIQENIPSNVIVESIRKAFVHADAVLQIMCHVQQKKNEARLRGEPPVTVNAPFLGQAISDACNITVIRALEVRGELSGVHAQRHRVTVGVEWLKELKLYWKPIESMYKKLKRTCRSLDRSSHPPSAQLNTPESSVDSGLQPGLHFSIDPREYTADPTADPTFRPSPEFPAFRDYLQVIPPNFFSEAFGAGGSQYHIAEYARTEGGFPDLYPYSSDPQLVSGVSATYEIEMSGGLPLGPEDMPVDSMQMDHSTMTMGGGGSYILGISEACESSDDDDDGDDPASPKSDKEQVERDRHAVYFDLSAVRDGNLQDSSSSDSSGYSRRASEAATIKHDNNPMDVLNLINTDGIAARLQDHQNGPDEFTGPRGAAAPENTEMGGQPNLDNSGTGPG